MQASEQGDLGLRSISNSAAASLRGQVWHMVSENKSPFGWTGFSGNILGRSLFGISPLLQIAHGVGEAS